MTALLGKIPFYFPIFRKDTNVFIDSVNNSIELYYWRFF